VNAAVGAAEASVSVPADGYVTAVPQPGQKRAPLVKPPPQFAQNLGPAGAVAAATVAPHWAQNFAPAASVA
jgi:hypothetical protein